MRVTYDGVDDILRSASPFYTQVYTGIVENTGSRPKNFGQNARLQILCLYLNGVVITKQIISRAMLISRQAHNERQRIKDAVQ